MGFTDRTRSFWYVSLYGYMALLAVLMVGLTWTQLFGAMSISHQKALDHMPAQRLYSNVLEEFSERLVYFFA